MPSYHGTLPPVVTTPTSSSGRLSDEWVWARATHSPPIPSHHFRLLLSSPGLLSLFVSTALPEMCVNGRCAPSFLPVCIDSALYMMGSS